MLLKLFSPSRCIFKLHFQSLRPQKTNSVHEKKLEAKLPSTQKIKWTRSIFPLHVFFTIYETDMVEWFILTGVNLCQINEWKMFSCRLATRITLLSPVTTWFSNMVMTRSSNKCQICFIISCNRDYRNLDDFDIRFWLRFSRCRDVL